jgi:protein O-mannosyl-transferase
MGKNSRKKARGQQTVAAPSTPLVATSALVPASQKSRLLVCGAIVGAVMAIYAQARDFDFITFDDEDYVSNNAHVLSGLTLENVAWAFSSRHAANWHPLTWLSHMLDADIYGRPDWAGGPHLTNAILHAATAIVLFFALFRLTGRQWPSAFVAAAFAVHPLRVESVAWVSERKDVLSGLFFAFTLLAYADYARRPSLGRYALVALSMALGLMAKPMLVTVPFVLLLLDYWPLDRWRRAVVRQPGAGSVVGLAAEKAPLVVLALASCAVTVWAQSRAIATIDNIPFGKRLANAAIAYIDYLRQFFWPSELIAYYPYSPSDLPASETIGAFTVLLAITALAVAQRRLRPYLLTGWLWYLGMLVPVIGLLQVGMQARADRYTYLPQIGLLVALAWAVADLTSRWKHQRRVVGATSVALLAILSLCSWKQTTYWRNGVVLFTRAVNLSVRNVVANDALGNALLHQKRFDEAAVQFGRAAALAPEEPAFLWNYGVCLFQMKRYEQAIPYLQRAVEFDPTRREASWAPLGRCLSEIRRYDEAAPYLENALKLRPQDFELLLALGVVRARQERPEEAIAYYRQALAINPDEMTVHVNLGAELYRLDRSHEALAELKKALQLSADHSSELYWQCLRRAAWVAATCQDPSVRSATDAVAWALEAVKLSTVVNKDEPPSYEPACLAALAAAYAEADRFSEAVTEAEHAIEQIKADLEVELKEKAAPDQKLVQNYRMQIADLQANISQFRAGSALRLPGSSLR